MEEGRLLPDGRWSRAIILLDMNAFFASIEQRERPELRGKPIVVTNGTTGSCVITSSYEARHYGIKMGMRLWEARELCPDLIQISGRSSLYAEVSATIMEALVQITPDIEVFSVDEAFLDITHCQKFWGDPVELAKRTQQLVYDVSGVTCSIGLSGDKTTAKYAAKLQKPNGFTVIPPWEARERLKNVLVTDLCGIADGIGRFLARHGVRVCGDMHKLPISVLAKRFGNLGRRIWYMCQGMDPDAVRVNVAPPKSIGHGKIMPPRTLDPFLIKTYLQHMSEKVGTRLRRHDMDAQHFFIGLRVHHLGWIGGKYKLIHRTQDGQTIYRQCLKVFNQQWRDDPIDQVQVTALDPLPCNQQLDLFSPTELLRMKINETVDDINDRYGNFTVQPASLLNRSKTPNVIAPAWKPTGHRRTV